MTTPEWTPTTVALAAPEIRKLLTRSAIGVILAAVVLVVLLLIGSQFAFLGFVVAGTVCYVGYVVLYLRRALVEFGGGRYRVREAATDVRFSAADVALVVPIDRFEIPGQAGAALVVIGKSRRRLAEINATSFGRPTLEAFVADLVDRGVPIDHLSGHVTPAEFGRRHPGVLSWGVRRPVVLIVLFFVPTVIVLATMRSLLA